MTGTSQETTQAGAVQTGTPQGVSLGTQTSVTQAATTEAPKTGTEAQTQQTGDPWYKGQVTDPENLKAIETAQWANVDAIIKSNREAQKLISQRPATQSQAPKEASEYKFNVPQELT